MRGPMIAIFVAVFCSLVAVFVAMKKKESR